MERSLKILMLEDVQDDVVLIRRALSKGGLIFESERVETKDEFESAIASFRPDVILSDHTLPQFNSLEALTVCRSTNLFTPFILVTGTVSEEFAVICLKQGADDYVLKSNLTRLPSVILNSLKQRELEEQRRKAEMELRLQNDELTKINRELDSFVYSISHNLRSPLMSVLGLVNLAKHEDSERDGHFKQYFAMMNQSILKLDDTLKEILDYSRNAREEINFQEINIHDVMDNIFERLKYLSGIDKIDKRVDIEGDYSFYSDAYRIMIILNNLVSNSIKYRDATKEKPFIAIRASIDTHKASITVEDNGIGIAQAHMPKIFNMFFRGSEKSDGAGLGLYIVKEAINKLHGNISVYSEVNVGTKFTIEIPNNTGE